MSSVVDNSMLVECYELYYRNEIFINLTSLLVLLLQNICNLIRFVHLCLRVPQLEYIFATAGVT